MTPPQLTSRKPRLQLSLFVRLAAAFAAVSILSIILSLAIFRVRVLGEFNHYVRARVNTEFVPQLAQYYAAHDSWQGVDVIFVGGGPMQPFAPRLGYTIISAPANRVVFSTAAYPEGEVVDASELPNAVPITRDAQTVGWLVMEPLNEGASRPTPETDFANQLTNTLVVSLLVTIGFAIVAGVISARALTRPIQALTAATRRVAQGELGFQVKGVGGDELGQLAEAFNHMSSDLAQANGLRRQMTADIAHELRTPLSVIMGYAEALHDGKLAGSPEIFESLHVEARHLQRLVEDLRILSLADAGELPLTREAVAPGALLERTRLIFAAQVAPRRIDFLVDAPPDLPLIDVDPDRIFQVLGNLVANALRYTPDGGKLGLSARREADQVEIRVQDSGAGIAPEDLPHIFDRFYRGDASRYAETGESGLGLAIAKSIVEAHGGTIRAESTNGDGSTMILRVPVASGQ